MKKALIYLAVSLMLACTACSDGSEPVYVDESKVREQYAAAGSQEPVEITDLDDKPIVFMQTRYSLSKNSIVVLEQDYKKIIDLRTGIISSFCDIPGCSHGIGSSDTCLEYRSFSCPLCVNNGMYYTDYDDPGKLYLRSEGEDKAVFENTFFTDKERQLEPKGKTAFKYLIRGDTMYVCGLTYFYTVDMKNMKQTCEPVVISDSPIWNMDVYGDDIYITNEDLELIRCNMKTGTKTKLADKVWRVQPCESGLYYIRTDGEGISIFRSSPDGSCEKKLISGVDMGMYISDSRIFFTAECNAFMSDLNGENILKIPLELTYENGEEYRMSPQGVCQFVTCPSAKYLWLLDLTGITGEKCCNAVFRIDKQTGECRALSLGIWYQPVGGAKEKISD